jgi:asparagine synthase (glutamine-hydrolysing)
MQARYVIAMWSEAAAPPLLATLQSRAARGAYSCVYQHEGADAGYCLLSQHSRWVNHSGDISASSLDSSTKTAFTKDAYVAAQASRSLLLCGEAYIRDALEDLGAHSHAHGTIGQCGALFQQLWQLNAISPSTAGSESTSETAWQDRCAAYWGDFFAFETDGSSGLFRCYLSPMARQEWFYVHHQGALWISNDFEWLHECRTELSADWDYLYYSFFANGQATARTGLQSVRRLLAGQSLSGRADDWHSHTHWQLFPEYHPRRFGTPNEHTIQALAQQLAQRSQAVVAARCAQHDRVLVQLSGGFDSAVLLACVRKHKAAEQVLAVNYFDAGDASDERHFAQIMADHVGVKLITISLSGDGDSQAVGLRQRLAAAPLALEPSGQSFGRRSSTHIQNLADDMGATAILTGNGGDQVFGQFDHHVPAVDYVQDHGYFRGLIPQLLASARLNGQSLWWVWRQLWQQGRSSLTASQHPGLAQQNLFPHESLMKAMECIADADWSRQFAPYPKVKQAQIQALYLALTQYRHSQHNFSRAVVHPFMSQPLVEFALTLPSYMACHRGISRGLARLAFRDWIPSAIGQRLWKGATISFFYKALLNEQRELREYLLSGRLRERGFFNAHALEQTLGRMHQLNPDHLRWILRLLDTEAWMRRWSL